MATATLKRPRKARPHDPQNLAELLERLGNVPLERVRFGPSFGFATEQDVRALLESDDKRICELIDGVLVEKPMGLKESILGSFIVHQIWSYLDLHDRGIAFNPDAPIRVRPGRIRFPDTGFISWERLPNEELPETWFLDVMAELAVEVLSKSNTPKEMELKLDDYFKSGVKLVWCVDPKTQTITVYTARHTKKVLTLDDTLDGGKVLPGFSLPLKTLFSRSQRRKKKS
ncbi:MAG: Uma2 family endonuclease [Planctomycetes bacterium]|nr:Uma2 family endonuclease [Planctomycetota bacterium]